MALFAGVHNRAQRAFDRCGIPGAGHPTKVVFTNEGCGFSFRRQGQDRFAGADVFEKLAGEDAAVGGRIVYDQQENVAGDEVGETLFVSYIGNELEQLAPW